MSFDRGSHQQTLRDNRAQSEVVGTILLIGVVMLSISMLGTGLLGSLLESSDNPQANLDGRFANNSIEIVHRGGDTLAESDLTVRIATNNNTSQTGFESGRIVAGNENEVFEQGEQWQNTSAVPIANRFDVWVIHEPTDTLIYEDNIYRETN